MSVSQIASSTLPLIVHFCAGRSHSFALDGDGWRRLTIEGEAVNCSGVNRETGEAGVGVYVARRPNGLLRIGFDVCRLGVSLRPAAIERLKERWISETSGLSKPLMRSVNSRAHFSRSFAQFEVSPERLAEWKLDLESILTDARLYESIEHRPTDV
jgi:hypothetical protein